MIRRISHSAVFIVNISLLAVFRMNFVKIISRQRFIFKSLNLTTTRTLPARTFNKMSDTVETAEFIPNITLATPLEDYKKLIEEKMQSDDLVDDDVMQENYSKISAKMRETIWKLLFAEQPPSAENLRKAGECLREHKMDSCFYTPYEYNEWIPKVRNELLKREMLDFWREHMVKRELGPCWAKDSDYFSDIEDEEPANFYKHAGCVAPFRAEAKKHRAKKPKLDNTDSDSDSESATAATSSTPAIPLVASKVPEKISLETACQDYKLKLEHQLNLDADDEEAYKLIFNEVRQVIWSLLFDSEQLSAENYSKAANTLEAYKRDACFFNPWDYNDWIPKVREELLARKHYDFWKNVIVERKLGLCWYKDSDFFDDCEDQAPLEFYKIGMDLMEKAENKEKKEEKDKEEEKK